MSTEFLDESQNLELPPLKDRMQAVRDLRKEYGDDNIPDELLTSVGFTSFEDENGLRTYIPLEQVATNGINRLESSEKWQLPHTVVVLECETTSRIGAKIDKFELRKRLMELSIKLYCDVLHGRYDDRNYESQRFERLYGKNHPALEVIERFEELEEASPDAERDDCEYSRSMSIEDALNYTVDHFDNSASPLLEMPLDEDEEYDPKRVSQSQAEKIVANLQRLRARTGDIEELEAQIEKEMRTQVIYNDNEWQIYDGPDILQRAAIFGQILEENGLMVAAAQLRNCKTLKDAQLVTAQALIDNELKRAARIAEKDWQERRKQAKNTDDIKALNVEHSALKATYKKQIRPLIGVDAILNIAKHYKVVAHRAIKDLEDTLITKSDEDIARVELHTKPDPKLDADPGYVSGDCTEGQSLKFGRQTGLHNVRVIVDGMHIGNTYLLEARTKDGDQVWHLDAIQIPNRQIKWDGFPAALVKGLKPLALEQGIMGITINSQQCHVSNYDYISKGFMQHFGTEAEWQSHGQMELLDDDEDVESICSDASRHCKVDFQRYEYNRGQGKMLQGALDSQIWLWRA